MTTAKCRHVTGLPCARARQSEVPDAGSRCHDDPRSGHLGAPAQVDILAEQVDLGVESAERLEQVRAHQGAAARYCENLPNLVVLCLVEFARLDALDDGAKAVDSQAHLEQPVRGVPLDELRADDACI